MRITLIACALLLPGLASCSRETGIERVREVPLKSTAVPAADTGLHRAQVTYLLRGALTHKEMEARLGQYYFVTWYDGHPEQPAELTMSYQQSSTGSQVHSKTIRFPAGRKGGLQKDTFTFLGAEHQQIGQILTWRVDLKIGPSIVSTRRSYLWRDDYTTLPTPE